MNVRKMRTLISGMPFAVLLLMAMTAQIAAAPTYRFVAPIFGLAVSPDGSLLVADNGFATPGSDGGIVELRKSVGELIAALPGVTDIAPIGRGDMFATTSFGPGKLYRVSRGSIREIADLNAFEARVNPDGGEIDSNPFDVDVLNGQTAIVGDAAANAVLAVDNLGNVDWIATLPFEPVPSAHLKAIANCPSPPPGFEFICGLPPVMTAQPVTASVAVGKDGAIYVGELKGFPAPIGMSKIWRIEPGTRHANCATSPACQVVASGFTSIVDLTFGPDGKLYVVELDEASWAAVEFGFGSVGGSVNACDSRTWVCTQLATGLPIPIAAAVGSDGKVNVAINSLIPGSAAVITLP